MKILHRVTSFLILTNLILFAISPGWASEQKQTPESVPGIHSSLSAAADVRSFGARGDGVSDDSAALQRAIDSLKDGGALFFPKGRYSFSQTLILPSNIRLQGDAKSSTVLLYQGTDKAIVSGERKGRAITGSYYITIENLTLQGANDSGTGLYLATRYLTVNNATISHFGTGIDCHYSWTNKFYNVSLFYNNVAFQGGSFLNANSFVNCIFSTGQIAVTFRQGWNVSFVGCQFEGYREACFSFHEAFKSAVWNLNINGCYFENDGKCLDVGPNCSFNELSLRDNIITTHGPGFAVAVDNSANYGKNTGIIENNTFFRDNNGGADPFVHLEGPAFLWLKNNKGFAAPGYVSMELLDEATRGQHDSSYTMDLADGNRLNFSGVGAFEKGVIIGAKPPAAAPGLLLYDNGKLKLFLDATQSEYLLTGKAGPSSDRPAAAFAGMVYFDTTLGKPLWWTGSQWVDANGESR